MTLPSTQDDGNVRAPALACLVCVAVQVVAVARVRWWSFSCRLGVFCPHPSSTDFLWRGCRATSQTPPVSLYAMLHWCSLKRLTWQLRLDLLFVGNFVVLGLLAYATRQLGLLTLGMQTPLVAVMVGATEHGFDPV